MIVRGVSDVYSLLLLWIIVFYPLLLSVWSAAGDRVAEFRVVRICSFDDWLCISEAT